MIAGPRLSCMPQRASQLQTSFKPALAADRLSPARTVIYESFAAGTDRILPETERIVAANS